MKIDPQRSELWNEILKALGPDVPPNDVGYRIADRVEALVEAKT